MKLNPRGISPVSSPTSSTTTTPTSDRRRRARQLTKVQGYLFPENAIDDAAEAEPWEVRITDYSKMGVGFITGDKLEVGMLRRVRVGNGPSRVARRAKVAYCAPHGPALFRVGAEFTK